EIPGSLRSPSPSSSCAAAGSAMAAHSMPMKIGAIGAGAMGIGKRRRAAANMSCLEPQGGGNFKARLHPDRGCFPFQALPGPLPEGHDPSRRPFQGYCKMNATIMDFLLARASVPIQDLQAPGPDDAEIAKIIAA